MRGTKLKWRTILGLIIILIAIVFNWNWMWGILFLLWVIPDIKNGYTFFIEPINRKDHPLLFWVIVIMWLLMSVYFLLEPVFPEIHQRITKATRTSEVVLVESSLAPSILKNKTSTPKETNNATKEEIQINEISPETSIVPQDTLEFEKQTVEAFTIAGVSMLTSTFNDLIVKDLDELWEYFYQNDIGRYIPHKENQKIYVLFSNYDDPEVSAVTVTIGYKIKSEEGIHKEMDLVKVPPMQFGIFSVAVPYSENVDECWEKIYISELERSNSFDLEVYEFNEQSLEMESAQIWAGLKVLEKPDE